MAFFTRAVMAASSKNELPPPEVAQPARPSSATATTSAKRCLSLLIFISLVRVPRDTNTAPKRVQPRKNRTLRALQAIVRVPRQAGKAAQPQNGAPAPVPCFATRRTIAFAQRGQLGAPENSPPLAAGLTLR